MQTSPKTVTATLKTPPNRLSVVKRMCPNSIAWFARQTNLSPIMGTRPLVALPGRISNRDSEGGVSVV